jgi:2'-5' RNA ligase
MKSFKEFVKEEATYDYSCVMVGIEGEPANKLIELGKTISDDHIYYGYDDTMGREDEPHITVLYGIYTPNFEVMEKILKQYNQDTVTYTIKGISTFENEMFDVLKFDIESDDLVRLNNLYKQLDYTTNFPIYHPHATIAYVTKGAGSKYIKPHELDGTTWTTKLFKMSNPKGEKHEVRI